jgi:tetratricopeptide (TPR) repeat protein
MKLSRPICLLAALAFCLPAPSAAQNVPLYGSLRGTDHDGYAPPNWPVRITAVVVNGRRPFPQKDNRGPAFHIPVPANAVVNLVFQSNGYEDFTVKGINTTSVSPTEGYRVPPVPVVLTKYLRRQELLGHPEETRKVIRQQFGKLFETLKQTGVADIFLYNLEVLRRGFLDNPAAARELNLIEGELKADPEFKKFSTPRMELNRRLFRFLINRDFTGSPGFDPTKLLELMKDPSVFTGIRAEATDAFVTLKARDEVAQQALAYFREEARDPSAELFAPALSALAQIGNAADRRFVLNSLSNMRGDDYLVYAYAEAISKGHLVEGYARLQGLAGDPAVREPARLWARRAVEKYNQRVRDTNDQVIRAFNAGNEQMVARNYDAAVAEYLAGLTADPTHPDAPSLLTNKSIALRARGIERYNEAMSSQGSAASGGTAALITAAQKDFRDAAAAAAEAVEAINKQPVPADPAARAKYSTRKYLALGARAEALRLVVTKVDPTQAEAALAAFQEYAAVETRPEKKVNAQLATARMLLDIGDAAKAYAEFQKVLAQNPENVDALLGAAQALFNTGDETRLREVAELLQRFVDKAPETHPFKGDAKAVLDDLRSKTTNKPSPAGSGRRPD